jgi:SAM-dependent MidA family methyltransferase
VPSASDDVVAAIAAAGGAIRFDEYMRIALYGEHGFYTSGGQAGRRGHFLTSPEVGPLFGAVLARWIDSEWQRLGKPGDFTIVECAAGPGALARSILAAAPQWRDRYVAVEVSALQRERHPAGVASVAALPAGPITGVVIANELLDNLPFRLAVFDGIWREAAVAVGRESTLVEVTLDADPSWNWLPESAPLGARLPIQNEAARWTGEIDQLLVSGTALAVDYCTATAGELVGMPWRDWLRTYRAQGRGEHYLRSVGEQDITAQVCVDQLVPPSSVESQADFLRGWGIEELVAEGRSAWTAAAAAPDIAALRMRSRISEAEALLDLTGLGGFTVLSWRREQR